MQLTSIPFVHDYQPGSIHFGRGCVSDIGSQLDEHNLSSVLVICGKNVGQNKKVMGPIKQGLGDRLAGVFSKTTPQKDIRMVYDAVHKLQDVEADAILAVGGGSTLDTGRFMRILADEYRPLEDLIKEVKSQGTPRIDSDNLIPLLVVPTTLAGSSLSTAAAVTYATEDGRAETIPVSDSLMPDGLYYDPDLFDTTPQNVLTASAMNGFDKAIECIYSPHGTPITDSTAVRALKYLRDALPQIKRSEDPNIMNKTVIGILLAQYGVSRPTGYKLSLVHAFGHALRIEFGLQQGIAHAVMIPHTLNLLFDQVDGRRDTLAEGLVEQKNNRNTATDVIRAVTEVRDGLELPSQLRHLDGTSKDRLNNVAELTYEDTFMQNTPEDFNPSVGDLKQVLEDAW